MKIILVFAAAAALCLAGETRTWVESGAQSFARGTLKGLAVRSDGQLSLAPKTSEVYDSSTPYLWGLVRDSRGNLYTGGGPGASLFRIAPDGKGENLARFDAIEVHALAIDSKDRLYVATSPDGKVYRVDASGKAVEFYSPGQKYIWAMVCDAADNLYVATGDKGEVHRVTPDGKGSVFFRTEETHARSLAFDREGNLIVGTEPGGLVIRVSKSGESFVLYEMSKREVTALAVGPDNTVYAAAVGNKTAPPPVNIPPPAAPAGPVSQAPGTIVMVPLNPPVPPAPPPAPAAGGAEVYRIPAKSSPVRLWSSAQGFVYALALDAQGRLLVGTGNKGELYRIENPARNTTLVNFPVAQITSLLSVKESAGTVFYAGTGNVGKVYRIGPALETEGTIESDVFDSGGFSTWGRISADADLHGGKLQLAARSGNLDRPQKNWSPWSKPVAGPDGGRLDVPPARFLQWKATLSASAGDASPTLDDVSAAYLRENVAPRVDAVEMTPVNYKFPAPVTPASPSSPGTLTLPALGTPLSSSGASASVVPATPAMTYEKGWQGVRWAASDENGDTLIFKVEIRGEKERNWQLLRDKVYERYFSFDSAAFPDGDYRIRITASDSPSNTPAEAHSAEAESDPFTIDNTPPLITGLKAASGLILWHAADALSTIDKAEYSLDGGDWTVVEPVTKLSDSKALDYSLALQNLAAGEHTIAVRVTDDYENVAVDKLVIR